MTKSYNVSDYNMLVPNNDYGMQFFKSRITYPGRSINGYLRDYSEKYSIEDIENEIDNNNLSLLTAKYIWCHTKMVIDVTEVNKKLRKKIKLAHSNNKILPVPLTRKIIPISDLHQEVLALLPEIILIEEAEKIIEKHIADKQIKNLTSKDLIIEMEEIGILRYSLNDMVKYHTDFINGSYFDYYNNPIPHHIIKQPELDNFKIALTENCSLNCTYCYYVQNPNICRKDMSDESLKKAILFLRDLAKFKKLKVLKICWWGGDPVYACDKLLLGLKLCDEILIKEGIPVKHSITSSFIESEKNDIVIETIKKYNIDVTISCDGEAKYHNLHRRLTDNSKYPKLSYDVMDKARYKILANTASFPEKCNDIENERDAQKYKSNYKIKQRCTIYTPDEIKNYQSLCEYFTKYNQSFYISMATYKDNLKRKRILGEEITKEIIKSQDMMIDNYPQSLNNIKSFFLNMNVNPIDGINFCYSRCGFGGGITIINPSGRMYSCHRFCDIDDFYIGSITDTPEEVNDRCKKMRRKWLCEFEPCKNCKNQPYCSGGGCAHEVYTYKGTVFSNAGCLSIDMLKNKAISGYIFNMLYPVYNKKDFCLPDGSYARHSWYF